MTAFRLALAQVNPTVGALASNAALVRSYVAQASQHQADLVIFPEMVLTGYPVEDLALRGSFVRASQQALDVLAKGLVADGYGDIPVVVGNVDRAGRDDRRLNPAGLSDSQRTGVPHGMPQNCAAVIQRGQVIGRYAKHHLPNYGVFDEFRIFIPGNHGLVLEHDGLSIGLAICEDLWQEGGPLASYAAANVDVLAVLNGSPYELTKDNTRLSLVQRRVQEMGATIAYCNMVGGQDDLVFDGGSFVVDATGAVIAQAGEFVEQLLLVDLPTSSPRATGEATTDSMTAPQPDLLPLERVRVADSSNAIRSPLPVAQQSASVLDAEEEVYAAVVLGLRDYVRKNGFQKLCLGLSGGIDSALVAAMCVDAVGPDRTIGVSMPSSYSSDHSKDDAADLAKRTGLDYRVQPIASMVDAFQHQLHLTGIAEENLQARVRGVILMGISNSEGALALATGNKSEMSVGYTTIYGDSVGGYAPLKDIPKTMVWRLASWRNESALARGETPPIPERSITKPPSAELRPGQTDQDSLPPYEVLDAVLDGYVSQALGRDELLALGHDETTIDKVVTLVDRAEWKRRQIAIGPKTSPVSFGRDRRLPVTSAWREDQSHPTTSR